MTEKCAQVARHKVMAGYHVLSRDISADFFPRHCIRVEIDNVDFGLRRRDILVPITPSERIANDRKPISGHPLQ